MCNTTHANRTVYEILMNITHSIKILQLDTVIFYSIKVISTTYIIVHNRVGYFSPTSSFSSKNYLFAQIFIFNDLETKCQNWFNKDITIITQKALQRSGLHHSKKSYCFCVYYNNYI